MDLESIVDDMTNSWQFPHKLITNDGFRYANIKATVAEIAVDEDEYGQPVVEKWQIYSHKFSWGFTLDSRAEMAL